MRNIWQQNWPGLVLLGSMAAITIGAGMICLPAGFITGGVLGVCWWVLDSLSGGGEA